MNIFRFIKIYLFLLNSYYKVFGCSDIKEKEIFWTNVRKSDNNDVKLVSTSNSSSYDVIVETSKTSTSKINWFVSKTIDNLTFDIYVLNDTIEVLNMKGRWNPPTNQSVLQYTVLHNLCYNQVLINITGVKLDYNCIYKYVGNYSLNVPLKSLCLKHNDNMYYLIAETHGDCTQLKKVFDLHLCNEKTFIDCNTSMNISLGKQFCVSVATFFSETKLVGNCSEINEASNKLNDLYIYKNGLNKTSYHPNYDISTQINLTNVNNNTTTTYIPNFNISINETSTDTYHNKNLDYITTSQTFNYSESSKAQITSNKFNKSSQKTKNKNVSKNETGQKTNFPPITNKTSSKQKTKVTNQKITQTSEIHKFYTTTKTSSHDLRADMLSLSKSTNKIETKVTSTHHTVSGADKNNATLHGQNKSSSGKDSKTKLIIVLSVSISVLVILAVFPCVHNKLQKLLDLKDFEANNQSFSESKSTMKTSFFENTAMTTEISGEKTISEIEDNLEDQKTENETTDSE